MANDVRAATGQVVLVCISTIKGDKRDAFRRHVDEVKAPAVRAFNPEVHASVRLLEPVDPNPDGTWTFVWLMDPAIAGEEYEMGPMYEALYGPEKAVTLMSEWSDCEAAEQVCYEMIQAEW